MRSDGLTHPKPVRRILPVAALSLLLLLGTAGASGSGYNLSYTRAAGSVANGAIDLISVSSTDPGGPNITASFQVSGALVLNSPNYGYLVWFGGSTASNSTAWVSIVDNSTTASLLSSSSFATIAFTTSGGSSASFSLAKAVVGGASTFGINVYAYTGTSGSASYSWLGTNYQATGGGGGTCTASGCTTTAGTALIAAWVWTAVAGAIVAVVVVVLVVVLLLRRKQPGTPLMAPPPPAPPPAPPPPPP